MLSHGRDKTTHRKRAEALNDRFAWGIMSTGNGYAQAEEILSVMNVPMMGKGKYRRHEASVGEVRTPGLCVARARVCVVCPCVCMRAR